MVPLFGHPGAPHTAGVLRSRDSNRRSPASRSREVGAIVGYELGGRYLYPLFPIRAATANVERLSV